MSKLEKPILFIVIPHGYDYHIRVYADWETDKSFGVRGEIFRAVRYDISTGEMYKKNTCVWRKFENEEEGIKLSMQLKEFEIKINSLKREVRDEIDNMKAFLIKTQ